METILRRKLLSSIVMLCIPMLIGVLGYMFIEDYGFIEAIYMTAITVATVGFSEVKPLSDSGRVFTIFLIFINLGVFTFALSQLTSLFLDEEFIRFRKTRQMKNKIKHLSGHVIVCGFGRNGSEACIMLHRNRLDFVIIEKEIGLDGDIHNYPFYLAGDATLDEVLIDAGIQRASAIITSLPDDANNLFVVLTARELNPNLNIISRATLNTSVKKLKSAGAQHVIMPDKIGGAQMASLIIKPDLKEFMDELMATEDVNLEELDISHEFYGKTLLNYKHAFPNLTVLGLKSSLGDYTVNPSNKLVLEERMKLICLR